MQHQEAWAKHLGVPVEFVNSQGMKYRLVPPGEFLRDSTREQIEVWTYGLTEIDAADRDTLFGEGPQHTVVLTQPIYVAATETTWQQYCHRHRKRPLTRRAESSIHDTEVHDTDASATS